MEENCEGNKFCGYLIKCDWIAHNQENTSLQLRINCRRVLEKLEKGNEGKFRVQAQQMQQIQIEH